MIKCHRIIDDGNTVEVRYAIRTGGELVNPIHLLHLYPGKLTKQHPLWMAVKRVYLNYHNKEQATRVEERVVRVRSPFP